MLNKIKNKYYQCQPGEFLPVFMDGELANRKQFHIYKLKCAARAGGQAIYTALNRAASN